MNIKVEPASADVKLAVSSFAPDELFAPRSIHLPPGRHVIIATAKGFNDAQKTVEVTDKAPQDVVITMLPLTQGGGGGGGGAPGATHAEPPGKAPLYIMGADGAIVLGAVASHLLYFKPARDKLADAGRAGDAVEYARLEGKFTTARTTTIALYAVGGAAVITGAILKLTVFKGKEAPAQVSVVPMHDGGMLTVGWSR